MARKLIHTLTAAAILSMVATFTTLAETGMVTFLVKGENVPDPAVEVMYEDEKMNFSTITLESDKAYTASVVLEEGTYYIDYALGLTLKDTDTAIGNYFARDTKIDVVPGETVFKEIYFDRGESIIEEVPTKEIHDEMFIEDEYSAQFTQASDEPVVYENENGLPKGMVLAIAGAVAIILSLVIAFVIRKTKKTA